MFMCFSNKNNLNRNNFKEIHAIFLYLILSCSQIFPTNSKKTTNKEAGTEISRHVDKLKK